MRGTALLCILIVVVVAVNAKAPDSELLAHLLADPNDCTAYYQFMPLRRTWPPDQVFSARKQVCDWTHNVVCSCNDTARRTPPADYTHLPGLGYYKRHEGKTLWGEARRICETEGGHLAIPDSQHEMDALSHEFGCCPWLGIYNLGTNRPWITVLGRTISHDFPIWKEGQPGSSLCAHLSDDKGGISAYDDCDTTGRFVCEFRG